MIPDVTLLPEWVLVGLAVGLGGSVVVGLLFAVAVHRSGPERARRRHGGDTRRREEMRAYLTEIGEPFAENHPVAGQPVAFYLPARDVAVTFDARAFFRIRGSDITPVLVEEEMPGVQLGARLPFETPEVDWSNRGGRTDDDRAGGGASAASDARAAVDAAFEELDLAMDATEREVRQAYRETVLDVHPDHGGDPEAFHRVRDAYATARQHASEG